MAEIVKADLPFVREKVTRDAARERFGAWASASSSSCSMPSRRASRSLSTTRANRSICAAGRTGRRRAASALQANQGRRLLLARRSEESSSGSTARRGRPGGVEAYLDRLEEAERRDHRGSAADGPLPFQDEAAARSSGTGGWTLFRAVDEFVRHGTTRPGSRGQHAGAHERSLWERPAIGPGSARTCSRARGG